MTSRIQSIIMGETRMPPGAPHRPRGKHSDRADLAVAMHGFDHMMRRVFSVIGLLLGLVVLGIVFWRRGKTGENILGIPMLVATVLLLFSGYGLRRERRA